MSLIFTASAWGGGHFANREFSQDRAIISAIKASLKGIEFSSMPGVF